MNDASSLNHGKMPPQPDLVIALTGNANTGKSAIFNQLTGQEQEVGNWPGTTVERAEGTFYHHRKNIAILDLPGTYSLSADSPEEQVSRKYITTERPDIVVDVIDVTNLERNLFLTLQLMELEVLMVVALNFMDVAKKKGITIDHARMQKILGVPVVPTVAIMGFGVHEIVDHAIDVAERKTVMRPAMLRYGTEVEERIEKLSGKLAGIDTRYPPRWTAIKLLEDDPEIVKEITEKKADLVTLAEKLRGELFQIHDEPCHVVIASERYSIAARIADEVQRKTGSAKQPLSERLDAVTMHQVWGYALMFLMMFSILAFITLFGGWLTGTITVLFERFNPSASGFWPELAWNGAVVGFYAALSVMFGFILPFYLILGVLEDSGYLPKMAFLMDRPCHALGLHGKVSMPLLLAFGCNVPACAGCRIMDTKRDKLIAIVLSTLVPCSARSAVILGLVGAFVGIWWAAALYVFDFVLIFIVGRTLNWLLPGRSVGIIMEIPPYRLPSKKVVLRQAWSRFRSFLTIAVPLIVIGSVVIEYLHLSGLLTHISDAMNPVTVLWLGLPAFTGILFIFGVLRKEAALVLLGTVSGTMNVASVMSPLQMVVFTLVLMLYIPCLPTIAVLVRETGWKKAMMITFGEIGLAVLVGGIAFRLLDLFI